MNTAQDKNLLMEVCVIDNQTLSKFKRKEERKELNPSK